MYYKNNLPYHGPKMSAAWFAANGYTTEAPEIVPVVPVNIYSKYKIVSALGENWPELKTRIEAAGLLDLWEAATELSTADPNFSAFFTNLSDAEKALLENCAKE